MQGRGNWLLGSERLGLGLKGGSETRWLGALEGSWVDTGEAIFTLMVGICS